jgi:hypothetical protein
LLNHDSGEEDVDNASIGSIERQIKELEDKLKYDFKPPTSFCIT